MSRKIVGIKNEVVYGGQEMQSNKGETSMRIPVLITALLFACILSVEFFHASHLPHAFAAEGYLSQDGSTADGASTRENNGLRARILALFSIVFLGLAIIGVIMGLTDKVVFYRLFAVLCG